MKKLLGCAAALMLGACGAGSVSSGNDVSDDGAELSSTTPAFVTLSADPAGGFDLLQPNHSLAAVVVSGLDFSQSNLSSDDIARVTGAPASELVLRGKLSAKSKTTGARSLIVLDAYRGMPGRSAASADSFFTVANNGKACAAAPCASMTASKISSTAKGKAFSTLSVASAAAAFVDQAWLSNRALNSGAIVTGQITSGEKLAGGTETVLDATQVFLHLPEGVGICSDHVVACSGNEVQVFERDPNRCMNSVGCSAIGMCPMYVPACGAGYSLESWRGTSGGCSDYACDPTWIH